MNSVIVKSTETEHENNEGKIRSLCKNFGNTPIFRELFRQQGNEDKSKD